MAASHPPRPTLTLSGHRGAIIVEDSNPTTRTARRHRSSPAYRRYLKNQHLHHSSVAPSGWARSSSSPPGEGGGHRQRLREVPSLLISRAMPVGFSEMDNGPLLTIAEMGNHGARVEVLKRHIMAVDGVDYLQAGETFERIAAKNREGKPAAVLPYHIGIATALICGVGVIPMVFDVSTAQWFNHHFVTTDLPEPHDLETYLGTLRGMHPIFPIPLSAVAGSHLVPLQMLDLSVFRFLFVSFGIPSSVFGNVAFCFDNNGPCRATCIRRFYKS